MPDSHHPNGRDFLGVTGPGGWGVNLKGQIVILVVLLAALGALAFYFHTQTSMDHRSLQRAITTQTCILSLTPDERIGLRQDLRKWQDPRAVLQAWCPWVSVEIIP